MGYVHIAPNAPLKGEAKNFFSLAVDNFFEDPDIIKDFGLSLPKMPANNGEWPGIRSVALNTLDELGEQLATEIFLKALSSYFDLTIQNISWQHAAMSFHEIPTLDENKDSIKNQGWIHSDYDTQIDWQLAGLIYLTPDIDPDTGTSLFKPKKDKFKTPETQMLLQGSQPEKCDYYKHGAFNEEEYTNALDTHLDIFTETTRFQNIYNRLIMYDAQEFHRANNFYSNVGNRFTLVFFMGGIEIIVPPMRRIHEFNNYDEDIKNIIGDLNG